MKTYNEGMMEERKRIIVIINNFWKRYYRGEIYEATVERQMMLQKINGIQVKRRLAKPCIKCDNRFTPTSRYHRICSECSLR